MSFHLTGITEMQANLDSFSDEMREKLRRALDAVLIEMANFIKQGGPGNWIDRTGNLRNSVNITGSVENVPSYKASEKKQALPELRREGANWTESGSLLGVIYAGMEYALYVELREGKWVISGAFAEYQDKILGKIAAYVNAQ